jgi:hypothetical protein
MKIDERILEGLIELGESGRPGIPASLPDVSVAADLLMKGLEPWYAVGDKLTEPKLKAIIQGFILYCRASGFSGGSVSPVIQLYREYAERFPQNEIRLNRWICENTQNAYEPFGSSMIRGQRTWREHEQAREDYRRSRQEELDQREQERLRQLATKATAKLPDIVKRGDVAAAEALRLKGADLYSLDQAGVSLLDLAREAGRVGMVRYLEQVTQGADPIAVAKSLTTQRRKHFR